MRNAPIVNGVPSPYALHVHPYPTRFHGPVYGMADFEKQVVGALSRATDARAAR